MPRFVLPAAVLLAATLSAHADPAAPDKTDVFVKGEGGYHTYRIPALAVTTKGTLLAFCEGRKTSGSDAGDIDLLLRRSTDGGKTWDKTQTVWDDADNTCGNPCPVVDRGTGTVWLLLTHNLGADKESQILDGTSKGTRTVWVTHSDDDGATWAKPSEITAAVKPDNWTWFATGPGAGIQLRTGRLVIPCDHYLAKTKDRYAHVIYSDDHGKTWQRGGDAGPDTNECEVVERADGSLLLNMRNYNKDHHTRAVATSKDGGVTWSAVKYDEALVEPVCQASIRRLTDPRQYDKSRLLFSNPASPSKREKLTVRLSYDDGDTWPVAKELHAGPAAYSCLAALPDLSAGCLYECGDKGPYEKITFARFTLPWLTDGKDKPEPKAKDEPITPKETTALFNGKDLTGLTKWLKDSGHDDPKKVFTVADSMIHVSGEVNGYLATEKEYRDYHLTVEYKWGEKTYGSKYVRNSGVLLHATGPDGGANGVWMSSVECQVAQGCVGDLIVIRGKDDSGSEIPVSLTAETVLGPDKHPRWKKGGDVKTFTKGQLWWSLHDPDYKELIDTRGKDDVESPLGEWTKIECDCDGKRISVSVNGTTVNECYDVNPAAGKILLQCEGFELYFRKFEIKPLKKEK